jgi:aminopeptidase N
MPIANQTLTGPIKTISYEESPLMSTYLVAIVVGLLEYIEGVTQEGIDSTFLGLLWQLLLSAGTICLFPFFHFLILV